jgi:hypothetical protein
MGFWAIDWKNAQLNVEGTLAAEGPYGRGGPGTGRGTIASRRQLPDQGQASANLTSYRVDIATLGSNKSLTPPFNGRCT